MIDDVSVAAVIAKTAVVASVVVSSTASLAAQISNSAITISGVSVFAGLTVSIVALVRFLIARSTTDEGRSTEMWTDMRGELDAARARADDAYNALGDCQRAMAIERAELARWKAIATQVKTEFRSRVGEDPASWPTDTRGA